MVTNFLLSFHNYFLIYDFRIYDVRFVRKGTSLMGEYYTKKCAKVVIFFDIRKFICKFVVIFAIWQYIEEKRKAVSAWETAFNKDIRQIRTSSVHRW